MKYRIVPATDMDYVWAGEGLEIILDRRGLGNITGLDRDDYSNFDSLHRAISSWAIDNGKHVWALNCYEHGSYAFSYIEGEPRQGWDTYPVFLVADRDMWSDKPDIEYLNGWYNGYLYAVEEMMDGEWQMVEMLTDMQADEFVKKNPDTKRYEEQERVVTELVEV